MEKQKGGKEEGRREGREGRMEEKKVGKEEGMKDGKEG